MNAGTLVESSDICSLVKEKLASKECAKGFLLDGFPRTLDQAKELDVMLKSMGESVDHVLFFDVPDAALLARVTGRLVHEASGRSYHETELPPKVPGKDDFTGDPLTRRSDDNAASLKTRLAQYRKETKPVIDYYKNRGMLITIDANQLKSTVAKSMFAALHLSPKESSGAPYGRVTTPPGDWVKFPAGLARWLLRGVGLVASLSTMSGAFEMMKAGNGQGSPAIFP
eukprot:GHVT01013196.1.p1 GENE.GHVT01013196.1~~GHVT01013196.1.p1  ORF type:complete len:227 (-),score=50.20 GHVT01013196.1:1017-1697(-)